jgi:type II secretory pathway pseudopilin PulG
VRSARAERGVALLEVLAALTIVSAAGLGVVGVVSASARAARELGSRERSAAAADRLLAAYALLTRRDLDLRLGTRSVGAFLVSIERPERSLYRIAVAEPRAPAVDLLVTVVYRADEATP